MQYRNRIKNALTASISYIPHSICYVATIVNAISCTLYNPQVTTNKIISNLHEMDFITTLWKDGLLSSVWWWYIPPSFLLNNIELDVTFFLQSELRMQEKIIFLCSNNSINNSNMQFLLTMSSFIHNIVYSTLILFTLFNLI